ncbi:MAG: RagB/SusD family nutrient uptake outer membrane protein [Bacteroidales bacterium]|nr:RagB/SusD family nutrient uptake outer membrane protein [Bacteroidales bacterium]
MKINKYITLVAAAVLLAGCDEFLETESYTKKTTATFPETEADAESMIAGIYAVMSNNMLDPDETPFYVYDLASDDRLGGGSTSNRNAQSSDRLLSRDNEWFEDTWQWRYRGIFRANNAIATMDNVKVWKNANNKNQYLGEAYFLRAFYYLDLIQLFGEVPLVLELEAQNLPKSPAEKVYAQITSDLLKAIEIMPAVAYPNFEKGHATKWAAEALLARTFLFYTGYYNQESLPNADGGTVSKSQVISLLEDCINNSGHALLPDQRSLWPYTNKYTKPTYKYIIENNVDAEWAGDNNQEVLFALGMGNVYGWTNRIVEFWGLRKATENAEAVYPFVPTGYSNGPVSRGLWDDWANDPDYKDDYRRLGSICDRLVEIPDYKGDANKEVENSNLFCKKYAGIGARSEDGSTRYISYSVLLFGSDDNNQRGLTQGLIHIRFADVLLMHSELTQTADGMNKVRARAKLPALNYSLENIKKERRYELCFEALRWNDLRRWGDINVIMPNQVGQSILNRGKDDKYVQFDGELEFMKRYQETGGFWKIPEKEVILSNGVLIQSKGWEDKKGEWTKLPYNTI